MQEMDVMMRQRSVRRAVARLRWHGLPPASAWRGRVAVAVALLLGSAGTAFAQLDPLQFMKTSAPNVLVVVDTSNRMQRDANNDYYDQYPYRVSGANWEGTIGVPSTAATYRRKYINLRHLDTSLASDKFETGVTGTSTPPGIVTIANTAVGSGACQVRTADPATWVPPSFTNFESCTRIGVVRAALVRALTLNKTVARFGLIPMRQASPQGGWSQMQQGSVLGNEFPVKNDDPNQQTPTDYQSGKWRIVRPVVGGPNNQQSKNENTWCKPDTGCNDYLISLFGKSAYEGGLIPAGSDAISYVDAPVKFMVDDAQTEATALINADTSHRNTVVVLVVGGTEGALGLDPASAASAFAQLGEAKRRVPIYVIAVAPLDGTTGQPIDDAGRARLRAIATNSGGQYMEITGDMINATTPGSPVPEFVRAVNTAVQHAFASETDFTNGNPTEYQTTSPIVGTVNLTGATAMNGSPLAYDVIYKGTNVIPQRSNVLLTTGVEVPADVNSPGFPGRLRAFRVYRPEPDNTKTSGYKFVADGTALWVARTPTAGEGQRNIFTVVNGAMVAFTTDNAETLAPYLNTSGATTAAVISYVRNQPLGGFIDSTPAFLDAPSLDPPPDADYPRFINDCRDRRTLIFIGGNDGMLHAIDGRTGVEVWAFIPANLLPKLRALRSGQPVGDFRFFVDGSPKLADVKIGGSWRTYMVFGEGPGGTFYQAMDVTMKTLGSRVAPSSGDVSALLGYFSDSSAIPFKWSFPLYSHFDYVGSPNDKYRQYGDLDQNAATAVEKTVGQTWSDPAVGQVRSSSGSWVTLVGSGFLPYSQQQQANRGGAAAGTTFYVIDMATGDVLDSRNVGNDGTAELIDNCAVSKDVTKSGTQGAPDCTNQKNALQSDPVATGPPNSRFVDTVYFGDLDGALWRFSLGLTGANVAAISAGPVKLYDARSTQPLFSSMAVVNVGGTQQYVFFGSGSDLLPTTPGMNVTYKLYGVLDQPSGGVVPSGSKFPWALAAVDGAGDDEKVSAYPAVAGDIVFFTTTSYKAATPWLAPDANVYALTFVGGPAYDNTGDNTVTSQDTPKVMSLASAGRATAPFVADQHLVLGVGGRLQLLGDPQDFNNGVGQMGVRILSWREIR